MGLFRSSKANLEKGRLWFFENNGSANGYREMGNEYMQNSSFNGFKSEWIKRTNKMFSEYCKYNIPRDIEAQWDREIGNETLRNIGKEKNMYELFLLFIKFDMLEIPREDRVYPIIEYLKEPGLDSFTMTLLCEILSREKKYSVNGALNGDISHTISFYAQKLLLQPITIDESYKKASHMQDYDFSDANIRKRIEQLLI